MYYIGSIPQGMIPQGDKILRIEDALIEEIGTSDNRTGYLLISYLMPASNNTMHSEQIRLNVSRRTIIINESGDYLTFMDLKEGMRINAEISAAMTRSIPPQSNAYRIMVLSEMPMVNETTDRVVSVDSRNNFLTTGNPYDMNDQMRFTVSDSTTITNQEGNLIPLDAIMPGQLVSVEHATFQTMSIPPQSPAYYIQVLK